MPKKFKFELEALLKLRTIEEEKAIQELGVIQNKINIAKNKVKELEIQYQQEMEKYTKYANMGSYSLFYQSFERFLNRIEDLKKQTEIFIESLQPELEEKRKKLVEAQKNKKILEKLKEKRWNEYKKELMNFEKKELFELNQKNINKMEQSYEYLEEAEEILDPTTEESSEDYKSRKEREYREYFKKTGIDKNQL